MKILIVMSGFFPGKNYGGPPVSVDNFCSLLKGEHDIYIVTRNHDMGDDSPYENVHKGWNDRGNSNVLYVSDQNYNYSTFIKVIRDIRPAIIYLQGLFQGCIIPCLRVAQKEKIKVVLAPRGELCRGAFDKKYKKVPYIWFLKFMNLLKNVTYQSTSEEETKAIKLYLGARASDIYQLPNIPSIPRTIPERKTKLEGVGNFVFISRIVDKKNLISAINYLQRIRGSVVFDIYGPIEDIFYWKECEKVIEKLPHNIKVRYQGVVSHEEIHSTFARYDSFLFPTYSENYGHVIAEALLSGCVPIISDQTPWSDINDCNAGWAIPLSKPEEFVTVIQKIVDMNDTDFSVIRNNVDIYTANKLKLEDLKRDYLVAFK